MEKDILTVTVRYFLKFSAGVILVLLGGCGQAPSIEGEIRDMFGDPLADVVVEIENSQFSAVTNKDGRYSVSYAPGTISLKAKKAGHSTKKIVLTLSDKSKFPAAPITLYQIPPVKGFFLVDRPQKKLVALTPIQIEKSSNQAHHNDGGLFAAQVAMYREPYSSKGLFEYKPSDMAVTIIDSTGEVFEALTQVPLDASSSTLTVDGRPIIVLPSGIFEMVYFSMGYRSIFKNRIPESIVPMDDEKMVVRTIEFSTIKDISIAQNQWINVTWVRRLSLGQDLPREGKVHYHIRLGPD